MIPPTQVSKSVASLDHFRSQAHAQHVHRHRALRCVICSVFILAVGALTAGGAIVVREYNLSRAYSSASCRVVNVSYVDDGECTFCDGAAEKGQNKATACRVVRYPCVRIVVEFLGSSGRSTGRGILFDDTMQASSEDRRCSLTACHKTEPENREEVSRFVARFTEGQSFNCFYDTQTLNNAIADKVYTQSDVIHCLLWPSIVVALCAALFVYVELSSRGLVQLPCGAKGKPSASSAPRPTSSGH